MLFPYPKRRLLPASVLENRNDLEVASSDQTKFCVGTMDCRTHGCVERFFADALGVANRWKGRGQADHAAGLQRAPPHRQEGLGYPGARPYAAADRSDPRGLSKNGAPEG